MGSRLGLALVAVLLSGDVRDGARRLERWTAPSFVPEARAAPAPVAAPEAQALLRLPARAQLELERLVDAAIERGDMPGAVLVAGSRSGIWFRRAFGLLAVEPTARPMPIDALFDLASVTKAVATATSVASLVAEGRLRYDDPAARFIPAFAAGDKRGVTIRALLTHSSGLPAVNAVGEQSAGLAQAVSAIAAMPLVEPGSYRYSDLGFIVLAEIVRRASGKPLDAYASSRLFRPLGMTDTGFLPRWSARLVPTERDGGGGAFLLGTVHDPRARALGGVSGHAGLFASADDLGRFARMLLGRGELDGVRVLPARVVDAMTAPVELGGARVTLGWDAPDEPDKAAFSAASFGHEGFTGTSLWIDPRSDRFLVLLTSRLHPDGRGRVAPLGQALRAVLAGTSPERVETALAPGIDALSGEQLARLRGKRLAVLTHDAARDRSGRRSLDVLFALPGVKLVRVLSPEHGLGGRADGAVADGRDVRTGLPVRSLYPADRAPGALFDGVDTLIVDLVDVGVRFYTYEGTLHSVLGAAALRKLPVLVLDRPSPLGGALVEGPLSDPEPRSLVNPFPLPVRHGLTLGELARFFAGEARSSVELEIVRASGWKRSQRFRPREQLWFDPSPNLRSPDAALLYPGVALFETTNLSVGRGTRRPFEQLGASWLDAEGLVREVSVEGVRLVPTSFMPETGPERGLVCRGVSFEITDADRFRPVSLALAIAHALRRIHRTEWDVAGFAVLLANRRLHRLLVDGARLPELLAAATEDAARFDARRRRYLAYE